MGIIGIGAVAVIVVVAAAVVLRAGAGSALPAPRLAPGYAPALLARAGFPATAHNVAVLHDHLGAAFLDMARDVLPAERYFTVLTRCAAARGGVPVAGGSARTWPQRVLDEMAAQGLDVSGLPRQAQDALLATTGTGLGLFGGSVFAPLPVVPAAFPTAGVVPLPRATARPVVAPAS